MTDAVPFPVIPLLLAGVFLLSAWSAVAGMSAVAHVEASRLPPLIRRMARDDKDGPPAGGMVGVANDVLVALGAAGICAFLQVGSFRMFADSELARTYGFPSKR